MDKKKSLLIGIIFLLSLLYVTLLFWKPFERARANVGVSITTAQLSTEKPITRQQNSTAFSLFSRDEPLYTSSASQQEMTNEILRKTITVEETAALLPKGFLENATLIRVSRDRDNPMLIKDAVSSSKEHYYYQQNRNGIPVYGATVAVHTDGNTVYAITGSVVPETGIQPKSVDENTAVQTAVNQAAQDLKVPASELSVVNQKPVLYNHQIFGQHNDANTYPALSVSVGSRLYIVSLTDGSILHAEDVFQPTMVREFQDCRSLSNGFGPCPVIRAEGGAAFSDPAIENHWAWFSEVYNFWQNTLQIDGVDGKGGKMLFKYQSTTSSSTCTIPLVVAFWDPGNSTLNTCNIELTNKSVIGHEYTHGVMGFLPNKPTYGKRQDGSIHEASADIMASGLFAATDIQGQMLPIDDFFVLPGANPANRGNIVGRLFDNDTPEGNGYICNESEWGITMAHANGMVLKTAYALMVHGTQKGFNGCFINGIGQQKALKVWWRMIDTYLVTNSNFRTVYDGAVQACADLYGATSAECRSVTDSLRAVEIDQQPVGELRGAMCVGVLPRAPDCTNPGPTATPIPSPTQIPTPIPTNIPTLAPTTEPTIQPTTKPTSNPPTCPKKIQGDADCNGTISITDYAIWRAEYRGGCTSTNLTATACQDDKDARGSLMDADFNDNGSITLVDYQAWKSSFRSGV